MTRSLRPPDAPYPPGSQPSDKCGVGSLLDHCPHRRGLSQESHTSPLAAPPHLGSVGAGARSISDEVDAVAGGTGGVDHSGAHGGLHPCDGGGKVECGGIYFRPLENCYCTGKILHHEGT